MCELNRREDFLVHAALLLVFLLGNVTKNFLTLSMFSFTLKCTEGSFKCHLQILGRERQLVWFCSNCLVWLYFTHTQSLAAFKCC